MFRHLVLLFLFASTCEAQTTRKHEFRHWTTADGQRSSTRLRLVEQEVDVVNLKRLDNGKTIKLRIDRLSHDDRIYLAGVADVADVADEQISETNVASKNWPQFHGPHGAGVSSEQVKLIWSDSQNIVWKTQLPGHGSSSPTTWGDHLYLTCYSGYGLSKQSPGDRSRLTRHLLCFDRETGRKIWKVDQPAGDRPFFEFKDFNTLHGYATSTPALDDSGVYVSWGTSGLACYSHDGEQRWKAEIGDEVHGWGSSASVVLYKNLAIIHAEIESNSVIAFEKSTGKEVWRVKTRGKDSWSTPLVSTSGHRDELIFHFNQGQDATLRSVNPMNGESFWEAQVLNDYLCPSPIDHSGTVFAIAHNRSAAIRTGGSGNVTDSHVNWTRKIGSEICTPVYHDGHLYFSHQESGIVYCLNAKTGDEVYKQRLSPSARTIYASAVLAGGRIYYVSRSNGTFVVAANPEFKQLAHNTIDSDDSVFNGTPAVSGGRLLIRSNKFLYCIGEK